MDKLYDDFISKVFDAYSDDVTLNDLGLANLPAYLNDERYLSKKVKNLLPFDLDAAVQAVIQRGHRFDMLNVGMSMALYEHKGCLFVQFLGMEYMGREIPSFRNYIQSLIDNKTLADFHYQNQTDQPEDISDDEWDNRREVWDSIFDEGCGIPSRIGFTYDFWNRGRVYVFQKEDKGNE